MNWARRVSAVWAMDARSRDRRSHRSAVLPAPAISVRRVMMRNSEQKDGRPGKWSPLALAKRSRSHDFLVRYMSRRSEEHTSELQSLMRISYAVFCLKKKQVQKATHRFEHKIIKRKNSAT